MWPWISCVLLVNLLGTRSAVACRPLIVLLTFIFVLVHKIITILVKKLNSDIYSEYTSTICPSAILHFSLFPNRTQVVSLSMNVSNTLSIVLL